MLEKLSELRLGPRRNDEDYRIAFAELEQKVNQIIRLLDEIVERLDIPDA